MKRVFIVGWDGATFDLIKPWVEEGRLPNIAEVMRQGTSGTLKSTLPPMTFPAWSSFMTGVNPGKHGIFDFMRQPPGTYDLEFVSGGHRRAASFWKLLSDAGRKVISVSVPCTYPPEKINGIMLSGFDAPGLGGSGARLDSRAVYPPELHAEIEEAVGGHPIGSFPMQEINQGHPDVALGKIVEAIRQKAATAKYLLKSKPWDCMMILFGESDGVGHHFWKYCDPDSPLYIKDEKNLSESIFQVYNELDQQLGEIRALLPNDVTLLMMSDHGFGGVSNCVLYPNCYLFEKGFLGFRSPGSRWKSRTLEAVKLRAVASLPVQVKRLLYRTVGKRLGSIESRVRYSMIDWNRTKAYFEENPYYPVVRINVKGRQPNGVVSPGTEYDEVCSKLIAELEDWQHPQTGDKIVKKAYRREDIYSGPCLEEAPDILVHWAEHLGYSYAFKLSSKSHDLKWCATVDPSTPENLAFFTGKSGSHRDDGIFLAHGPGVASGLTFDGGRLIDMAPTILHLLDVPIPDSMDGHPVQNIFTDEHAVRDIDLASCASTLTEERSPNYSEEDEEAVRHRLRALGYID